MAGQSRILELASQLKEAAMKLESACSDKNIGTPSFSPDFAAEHLLDKDVAPLRKSILEATDELHALVLGPASLLLPSHNSLISLQALVHFDLANCIPADAHEASYADISRNVGLPEQIVARLFRHAAAHHIFRETRDGVIEHTGASRLLANNAGLQSWIGMVAGEMWPAATKVVDALAAWPHSGESNHTGYNVAHNTNETIFGELSKHPARQRRYNEAMAHFSKAPGLEASQIVNSFDWASLPTGALVVDVGGGYGSVSLALATSFPSLHFVVQDQADVVASAPPVPLSLAERVSFETHDFFALQPARTGPSAHVFLLRWVLHDWSDQYAAAILRALTPQLQPSSRVLINEYVMPRPGTVSSFVEKTYRSFDMSMLEIHNGRERDRDDWTALLHLADPRFTILAIRQPPSSRLSLIEIGWRG